ncbi:[protein-PII] uridylyltransferase [Paraferrimonas sp. SM1919]|uniref:[protein-PII] uridylyltransferase n=1 Tax=Paraferrimonas sp. SM1919 TaxID=2662263 RepID=UPI0013D299FB|nr:[protein-PII] uridylyltransferase [Paraferrimonas sp. SM1919]
MNAQEVKDYLIKSAKDDLQLFTSGTDVRELVFKRSNQIDQLLLQLWQHFGLDKSDISLIAVGGYGRGELHPKSDIDLLFLLKTEPSPPQQQALSDFITFMWDAKLNIGHSTRTLAETYEQAKDDVTIATNLLEARLLTGDQGLFEQLQQLVKEPLFWPAKAFFKAKYEEQLVRHQKASAFDLEPNIKSCPGGLRDIQTITWVTMRHFDARRLDELVEYGFLDEAELNELNECRDFLWQVRYALHSCVRRPEERLLFDLQHQVAELLGYKNSTQLAVEQMMKRYYRTVRRVIELNQMLLQLFKRATLGLTKLTMSPMNADFRRFGRYLDVCQQDYFDKPENILKFFLEVARNSNIQEVYAPTLRLLRKARRSLTEPLVNHPACRKVFIELLREPRGIAAFKLMHKYNIMASYLPAWRDIEGQMQFDLFHAYTVDEHTNRLLQNIERFSKPEHKEEFPLGSILILQLPKRGLLVLAAIFHDIAKGRGGDHSELGAVDALEFCQQHQLNMHDGRLVAWLVENHLLMSTVAQRRDINDPDVVNNFALKVSDASRLDYLYCLTVADICATNDTLWNNWKGSLLRELYFSTSRVLARGQQQAIDLEERIAEHQAKALKELSRKGFKASMVETLWQRFPSDYFIKFQPRQISWQTEGILKHKNDAPLIMLSKDQVRGGTELFVYCPDKSKLFTTVVSQLGAKNITVHDAIIFSTKDDFALDSFVIMESDGTQVNKTARINSIKKSLEQVLGSDKPVKFSQPRLPRQMKHFSVETKVTFIETKDPATTLVEVMAFDEPGLLAKIGEVFHQCGFELESAKITTIGERAEDFFTVSADGKALSQSQQLQLHTAMLEHLSESAQELEAN